jgi:SAM-dependent methyltransferase
MLSLSAHEQLAAHPDLHLVEGLKATVNQLYRQRFPAEILAQRDAVWKVLCRSWFARYIPKDARLLEVAAGYCEFINNVQAAERVAVDLNPDTKRHAAPGVLVHEIPAQSVADELGRDYFDTAFMSNFLEHCRSRDEMLAVLKAVHAALKPGGRLLILGPNFRCCYKQYFDYFDHYLPLTEKAIVEAIRLADFEPEVVAPKTLPFTFRSRFPKQPWVVSLYLRLSWLWPLFGAQFFVVGRKPGPGNSFESANHQAA